MQVDASETSFTQSAEAWADVSSFADAVFWIDVAQLTGSAGAVVQLVLQSSPTLDEAYFMAIAPPVTLYVTGGGPIAVKTLRTPNMAPLARHVRWQLQVSGNSGTWGATLRVRMSLMKQSLFVPTDVQGCALWLRGDLGVTLAIGPVAASGTTPPAVTITGTPLSTATASAGIPYVEIFINGAGVGPAATFSWALDGDTQQTGQSCTSTFTLGQTGLTANFPNAQYFTNDVYQANLVVASWTDQSANGYVLSQATAADRPSIGVDESFNSLPTLEFNGTSQLLALNTPPTFTQPAVLFAVARVPSLLGATAAVLDAYSGVSVDRLVIYWDVSNKWEADAPGQTVITGTASTSTQILAFVANGTASSFYQNGVLEGTGTAGTNPMVGVVVGAVGNSGSPEGFFEGGIAEILVYEALLTPAQLAQVTNYLGGRYGIAT